MRYAFAKLLLILGLALSFASQASAQKDQFLRTNPKFVESFREVVAKPSRSTVRILCDDKDAALGMVVGSDGWILSKANDLKGKVACKLKDGRQFDATIVGIHKEHDLAMLKIDAKNLVAVEFTPSKGIDAGSWVACAGIKEEPVGIGVVSVSTRTIAKPGPTFTVDTSKSGFLGVTLEPGEGGVKIMTIQPKSAAEKAGLKPQDTIVALKGQNITEVEAFIQEMARHKPGDVVTLKIVRGEEELELKATLEKRPPNRGDFQNRMGSELSSRRTGYPTILQHDSVVKPTDCGGPIVDLEGRVIGINICRAGRTESWAVPSEVVQTVLADLKSGKLAPPTEDKTKLAAGDEKARAVDALLEIMKQRLELSADAARFKYANKVPITDSRREEMLLAKLLKAAEEKGLDQNLVREFFRAQFAASRALQEDLHAHWAKSDKALPATDVPDLKGTLRPKMDQISQDLLQAFAKAQPHLRENAVHQLLRERSANVLQGEAISDSVRKKALEGWLQAK
jgi:serine protease Do